MQTEDWPAARKHLRQVAHGRCQQLRAEALLLLGQSAYHEGLMAEARQAFSQVREIPGLRNQADHWLEAIRQRGFEG